MQLCVCAYVCELVCVRCVWLHVCRAKHPVKVHVWAGISLSGSTGICVFSGIMKAPLYVQLYVQILEETLLPFLQDVFPTGHRFMQDNDPKHISRLARAFFEDNGVHWLKTPPPPPPQSLQIPTPSKISGMSLRSTSGGKSSLTIKMN